MTDARMRELVCKQEIREVLERYCRGIDRLDEELVRSVYHPDATDDHGTFKGRGVDFAGYAIVALREHAEATTHMLGQSLIEVDGDVAHAETYVLANHSRRTRGELWLDTFAGRYVDRLERREGEWKIADRVVVHEWSKVEPVARTYPAERFQRGARSPQDLAYHRPRD